MTACLKVTKIFDVLRVGRPPRIWLTNNVTTPLTNVEI